MDAVVCHGPGDYRFERIAVPALPAGGAVLRVEAVGICASDVKCFQGAPMFWGDESRPAYCEPPVVAGHEFIGIVEDIDAAAASRWNVDVGSRVAVEQIVPCGACLYCRRGSFWLCDVHRIFGFKTAVQGAMAEYVAIPSAAHVYPMDAALPAAHAAFTEPLACALHAVDRADLREDDVVVVAGAGPIGLGMVAGAARSGVRTIIAVDANRKRLEVAARAGASSTIDITTGDPVAQLADLTDGYGCDVYFEATGHPSAVPQGLQMLRKQGRFVEYSVFKELVSADWTIIGDSKELTVLGAHLGAHRWPTAIDMIERGLLPLDLIITHELPLADYAHGLSLVAAGTNSIKVVLVP
jgi:threonine dehydrogenase-like Zn-dependent dehydrogenase